MKTVKIDIWSDVVCPWCYIGKRNLEAAIATLPADTSVEIQWHSYQLDPMAAADSEVLVVDSLSHKYGVSREQAQEMQANVTRVAAQAGLAYRLAETKVTNTRDAHRLIHWAASQGKANQLKERLLKANFIDQLRVGNWETLCQLAAEVGLDSATARTILESGQYGDQVDQDQAEARERNINGVPFFLFNNHAGFSGARPPLTFVQYIQQALA